MKNVKSASVTIDGMGNAMVKFDKCEMLVMVSWELREYSSSNEYKPSYSIQTNFGFTAMNIDEWDLDYRHKEHEKIDKIKSLFKFAKIVLDMNAPIAPVFEKLEDNDNE